MPFSSAFPHETRLFAALRLLALVGLAELLGLSIFIASVGLIAVGFGATP